MRHRVIGVDLGTTYSAVAAFDLDLEQAEIILNDRQRGMTPSVVAWNPRSGKVAVGQEAKAGIAQDPGNVSSRSSVRWARSSTTAGLSSTERRTGSRRATRSRSSSPGGGGGRRRLPTAAAICYGLDRSEEATPCTG